jgi:transcriptional regulator with XRE-family HTH domain
MAAMPAGAPRKNNDQEARRHAFGHGLSEALLARGLKQADLAELLTTTQSTVSAWINGRSEPAAATVFAIEEVLELSPGFLSRLLGYLPLSVVGSRPSVEESIATSEEVDDASKRLALSVWRTLVDKHKAYLVAVNGNTSRRTRSAASASKATAKKAGPSPVAKSSRRSPR